MATVRLGTYSASGAGTVSSPFTIRFDTLDSTIRSKNITQKYVSAYVMGGRSVSSTGYVIESPTAFYVWDNMSGRSTGGWVTARLDDEDVDKLISGQSATLEVYSPGSSDRVFTYYPGYIYFPNSSYEPYAVLEYTDPEPYLHSLSPNGGFVPKYSQTVFSWGIGNNADGYRPNGDLTQTSGTLQWRVGSSGTINSINVGTAQQYTIPAGTFTEDDIQWRVSVVVEGTTLTSNWISLSTAEVTSTAAPVSPRSGYLDGAVDNTFTWSHIIDTGTQQTKFDLQTSTNGSSWSTTKSESTSSTSTVIPANTFDAGPLFWRVRTYNTDDVAGEWSDAAQVIVIAAPLAPVVTLAENSPRPVINWQGSGQQGYEIQIDGETVANAYGVEKTYRAETYLSDGQHTIRVRVRNQYGLWSNWGSVALVVSNVAGAEITLSGYNHGYAALSWSTDGTYTKYYVYRDGELLAKTASTNYDDALTVGAHVYQVRGAYDDSGDYGLSNSVNVVVQPETVTITVIEDGTTITLPLSESNKRSTSVETSRQMATMYFSGSPLPSIEIAEWTDTTMTITAAVKAGESITHLTRLVGKLVCVRDSYGNCVIGPLQKWSIRSGEYYTTLQTTIQDVHWREAIKHDPIT